MGNIRISTVLLFTLLLVAARAGAQAPTGDIAGAVADATGGALAGARVSIVHRATGQTRTLTTSADGRFATAALSPGEYQITVEAEGFGRLTRLLLVEAGTTSTVEETLEVGTQIDQLTVVGREPLLRRQHHQVGGIVTRDQIDKLPLNGRNFLELAKLEPGVIPVRLADGRMFVSSLGGGPVVTDSRGRPRITTSMFPSTTRASAMMYWPPRSNPSVPSIGVRAPETRTARATSPDRPGRWGIRAPATKKFARTQSPVRGRGSIRSGNVVAFLLPLHSWNGAALSHRIGAAGAAFAAT